MHNSCAKPVDSLRRYGGRAYILCTALDMIPILPVEKPRLTHLLFTAKHWLSHTSKVPLHLSYVHVYPHYPQCL